MPKLIPFTIKRNDHGFGQYDVIENTTREVVDSFPTRQAAKDFILTATQDEDGEWEIDYESIWLDRQGDPDAALARAERAYEAALDRPWGDA